MGIQHAPAVRRNKLRNKDFVEPGEDDELCARAADRFEQKLLPLGATRIVVSIGHTYVQARRFGSADGQGAGTITADERNAGREIKLTGGVDECLEVGTSA